MSDVARSDKVRNKPLIMGLNLRASAWWRVVRLAQDLPPIDLKRAFQARLLRCGKIIHRSCG